MKKLLLLGLLSLNAFAIDDASGVIKSIECQAVRTKSLNVGDKTKATIALLGFRKSPKAPLTIDYSEEFWAQTDHGPQRRTISYDNIECNTTWYRTGASSLIGREHYKLSCQGESASGNNALVVLELDSMPNDEGTFMGIVGTSGAYELECSYQKFGE